MLTIQGWTQDSCQTQTVVLPDGTSLSITMNYVPMQYGWFIQQLTYGDFQIPNLRMVTGLNLLTPWKNIIPFGVACGTIDGMDSTQQQDLFSGYAVLYILEDSDLADIQGVLSG